MRTSPALQLAVLAAALCLALPHAVAVPVTAFTVSSADPSSPYRTVATITSIVAGGYTYSGFVTPSQINTSNSPSPEVVYWGQDDTLLAAERTVANVLLSSADITRGTLNPGGAGGVGVIDLMFPSTIANGTGADVFLFDIGDDTTDTWSVRAITGGTVTSPILGSTTKTLNGSSQLGVTATQITFQSNASSPHSNLTMHIVGAALDVLSDLGVSSLVGVRISSTNADPSVVVAGPSTVLLPPLMITTQQVGTSVNLDSVSLYRDELGHVTVPAADLIGVDLVHFKSTTNQGNLYFPTGASAPGAGNRASLIEDLALNTGVINPGAGTGLTVDPIMNSPDQSGTNTQGMGVLFSTPVLNGPGPDVILFEIDDGAPDAFVVSPIVFGTRTDLNAVSFLSADYVPLDTSPLGYQVYNASSPVTSLLALETLGFGPGSSGNPHQFFGALIDLSDLGYGAYEPVSGLFLQSLDSGNTFDPTLIVGLQSEFIPEPATMFLLAGGLACLARRRTSTKAKRG
ncbi:MAG TPA: PEP-CTERM sorting domain-containing protein [Planctomycetota bacterium]|nr:PEP-CTERM sorting domain-containing protein [Planctomycetota bacterium]